MVRGVQVFLVARIVVLLWSAVRDATETSGNSRWLDNVTEILCHTVMARDDVDKDREASLEPRPQIDGR